MMNISWVLSNNAEIDPTIEIKDLKRLGSFWGGWRTWRTCQTDNVVCHDSAKSAELIQREFYKICNLYIPNNVYTMLNRPAGVKLYHGDFAHDVDNQEDIVAMHLATTSSDIVLLLGFDFAEQPKLEDRLAQHRIANYQGLTKQVMIDNPNKQWVVVDHPKEFRKDLHSLPNLQRDSLSNILSA